MAIRTVCPRCAEFISSKDAVCPYCGYKIKEEKLALKLKTTETASSEVDKVEAVATADKELRLVQDESKGQVERETVDVKNNSQVKGEITNAQNNNQVKNEAAVNAPVVFDGGSAEELSTKVSKTGEGENGQILASDVEKTKPGDANLKALEVQGNDGTLSSSQESGENASDKVESKEGEEKKRKRHKHKQKIIDRPVVEVESDGSYNINTSDVTFFEGAKEEYSAKKARGEGEQEKIQWWEIYKWADLYLARRKINKEVNKAAVIEPAYISHVTLLLLCFFFGIFGAHNYYAKNYKKGAFVSIALLIAMIVVAIPELEGVINVSVGGGLGFIVVAMWVWDFVAILFYKYKFRESKLKFISKLNLETRKKLGKKYVTIREWFVPYEERKKKSKLRQTKINGK